MVRKLVLLTALIIVLVGILGVSFSVHRVEASGTIYIRADGSIDPPTAPISTTDNETYYLLSSISENIYVERNDIVVDGHGYTVHGTGSGIGIALTALSNVTLKDLTIEEFWYGIRTDYCTNCTFCGITIQNNIIGIEVWMCEDNRFYHNNFIDNTDKHVDATNVFSSNTWDNGYPSGGNYWDNYPGYDWYNGPSQTETGSDGIGDTTRYIAEDNIDNYPLMGMFTEITLGPIIDAGMYDVNFVSNSELSAIGFAPDIKMMEFNVSGPEGTSGFCRVCIPHGLMEPPYHVFIDGEPFYDFTVYSEENVSCLYFNYTHSTHEVTIVQEFPSFLIPPLFMIVTLVAVIIQKRKHMK